MRRSLSILTLLVAAIWISACGGPVANNAPANNSNANTAKPTAAAPTVETLFEMDKKANEAWIKGDKAHFEGMLSDKFTSLEGGQRMSKADMLGMIGSFKCDIKTWSLEDPKMSKINDDTYVVTYKGNFDGSCAGPDGKAMKIPSPTRAASIWVREGTEWKGAFHGENRIIDPKNPPALTAKAEEKKDEAKKVEPKKEADKTAATASEAKPEPAKPSANTEALVKLHNAGWEAFKAKDAKAFDGMLTSGFTFVDPAGGVTTGKADAIKLWTETMKCEGITKVAFTDGVATALSPTAEILTGKGTADGTCDGQKNGDLHTVAVYVKEGDAWKLAFMFESLPKPTM